MTDFDYDVMQKKRIASQARYRKRGSKSKKCSLPSDHITEKKWKEMCGPVKTFKTNSPITWRELKTYPHDIQEKYLKELRDKYGATAKAVADMLGVTPSHLCKCGFTGIFSRGARMTEKQIAQWDAFLREQGEDISLLADTVCDSAHVYSDQDDLIVVPKEKSSMNLGQFSLSFSGAVDMSAVMNSILSILGGRTVRDIQLTVTPCE